MSKSKWKASPGNLDAYIGFAKNLDRTKEYHYSEAPLYYDETVLIGSVKDDFVFDGDVSNLIGSRIALMKGAIHGPAFDNMYGILRVPRVSRKIHFAPFYDGILKGEYRFIVLNARLAADRLLDRLGFSKTLRIYAKPVAVKPYYLVFPIGLAGAEKLAQRFNRVHRLYRSTGDYSKLLDKYNLNHKLFPR